MILILFNSGNFWYLDIMNLIDLFQASPVYEWQEITASAGFPCEWNEWKKCDRSLFSKIRDNKGGPDIYYSKL